MIKKREMKMKNILLIATLFCTAFLSFECNAIPEPDHHRDEIHITTNTTWSGEVNVTSDICIDNGITLTILPGTELTFDGHYSIVVQGRLLAEGTVSDSIFFLPANPETGWNRILFLSTSSSNDTSKMSYCVFTYSKAVSGGNPEGFGGVLSVYNFNKIIITNSRFQHNSSYLLGGAISCQYAEIKIQNCIFNNNRSDIDGGAINLDYCNPLITGNLFLNNQTNGNGGAINFIESYSYLTNNTFSGNNAAFDGGAVGIDYFSAPVFTNCIFYGNTGTYGNVVGMSNDAGDPDFYYCLVEGGVAAFGGNGAPAYSGNFENNLDQDPLFAGSGIYPFQLQNNSPCVNAGKPDMTGLDLTTEDLAGNSRIGTDCADRIDMGAYESQGFTSLSFSGAITEDTIWCVDTVNIIGDVSIDDGVTLTIEKGVLLYFEGEYVFAVNGRILAEGDTDNHITFKPKITWPGWSGMTFIDVAATNDSSKLLYCTFESGNTDFGGALYISNSGKLKISNCEFLNNSAENGGAMFVSNATLVINNCIFANNQAYKGAAIYAHNNANLTISGNYMHNNSAIWGDCGSALASHGGGIYLNGCIAEITDSRILITLLIAREGAFMLRVLHSRSPTTPSVIMNPTTALAPAEVVGFHVIRQP